MPNQVIQKGDVLWVPYRRHPLWPALVHHVYPKRVTYSFFPLTSNGDVTPKKSRFSCLSKATYALTTTETLPKSANPELKAAFRAACAFLSKNGRTRGSEKESMEESGDGENEQREVKLATKRKIKEEEQDDGEVLENKTPSPKKATSSSSDRSSPSGSQQIAPITHEESKEMMQMINDRLDTLIDEIWKSEEVEAKKQPMKDKMTVKLRNNQFLSDADYESLFERITLLIRARSPALPLITAFDLTATCILPHVLIHVYSTCKHVDLQTAKDAFYQQNTSVLGLDPSMSIPVTNHLEELCRLACDESDAI